VSLLLLACMQVSPLGQDTKTQRVEPKPPLRYRLIVSEPSVCFKDDITLELELQNTSDHKVSIDPRVLLYMVDISRDHGATSSTGDVWGPKVRPDQTVDLAPGQSYRKTTPYSLQRKFFSAAGLYNIEVIYGQFTDPYPELPDLYTGVVDSNKVLFEIKDCDGTDH
jgi:hypothetical protein